MCIGAKHAIAILVAKETKMREITKKSYENFVDALWEATFEQSQRKHAAQDAKDALKAAALAWKEAAAPEVIGSGFYEKKPLDLSRFKPST
jgi:hypothetical protein